MICGTCLLTGVYFDRDVLFQEMRNLQPAPNTFNRTSIFHLLTVNYPNYIDQEKNVCELSLAAGSRLEVTVFDLRSIGQSTCPFKLYINDRVYQYEGCADDLWRSSQSPVVTFDNDGTDNRAVQIAFIKDRLESVQAKFWIRLQSMSTATVFRSVVTVMICKYVMEFVSRKNLLVYFRFFTHQQPRARFRYSGFDM